MYAKKSVGLRIEPCGTPQRLPEVQTARGPDTLNSVWEVVGEPDEAVIWKTKAVESADKNAVIDRVESLGQVDEYGCTVLSLIDGGYDIDDTSSETRLQLRRRYGGIRNSWWSVC